MKALRHNKFGFSLFEVVLTMGIVAIFIAACSNVFTHRHITRNSNPAHGRIECYWGNDGKVHQRTFYENMLAGDEVKDNGRCQYAPSRSASYVLLTAVGGGGYGGEIHGGTQGDFENVFLSNTTHYLEIEPGKAAQMITKTDKDEEGNEIEVQDPESIGHSTVVYDKGIDGNDDGSRIMYSLNGGPSDSSADIRFSDCSVTYTEFACAHETACTIDNDKKELRVDYCTSNESPPNNPYKYGTYVKITFDKLLSAYNSPDDADDEKITGSLPDSKSYLLDGLLKYSYTVQNWTEYYDTLPDEYNYVEGKDTSHAGWDINDTLTYFSIAVRIGGNYTEYEDLSPMSGFINGLNIDGGIADLDRKPGNGGAKGAQGGDGAAIIVW